MSDYVEIFVEKDIHKNTCSNNIFKINGEDDSNYNNFFHNCLVPNKPCIITNIGRDWPCFKDWSSSGNNVNLEYLCKTYDGEVPVAECDKKVYDVQEKIEMSLSDYLEYWNNFHNGVDNRCLYLKDWHFVRKFPNSAVYRAPMYFASDWLGEYYDHHPELNDDYRFVYIGPKGSWTPLHMDVFSSYSWSINIVGRKRWLLLEPGIEEHFKDKHGHLFFDNTLVVPTDLTGVYDIQQEAGEAIFVPSGWHHQVWNMEDTISINHNWVNGSNIFWMWKSLQDSLRKVKNEIKDCEDMDNWDDHCQIMLKSLFGINFNEFYKFLSEIVNQRIECLNSQQQYDVFGGWKLGSNYLRYDVEAVLKVIEEVKDSPGFTGFDGKVEQPKDLYFRIKKFLNLPYVV